MRKVDRKVHIKLPGKGNSNSHGEACPPHHLVDEVDSNQQVVNEELSLWADTVAPSKRTILKLTLYRVPRS